VSALAEALAPLYRAYLRRLEEMAGRIGEEAALREPLLRDDEQRLVRNESGFAVRFDLADGRSGETFEVHGARPDDPAFTETTVGTLPFRIEPGNWEELTVRCVFADPPVPEASAALAELVGAWAVLAAQGGFAGESTPAAISTRAGGWSARLHSATVRPQRSEIVASLDLGTCPPPALDALGDALAGFSREVALLARIVVGGTPAEDS
jgi:hypothetical protein